MKKIYLTTAAALVLLFSSSLPAYGHVTVNPREIGAAARTNFIVSVPTEEVVPTVSVRLIIPDGLKSVRPNAKPGWNIEIKKTGEGEGSLVTELIWTGGSIPPQMRDEFVFSAQAPATVGNLVWKAHQTYQNGKIISWDASPEAVEEYEKNNPPQDGEHDDNAPHPYSETQVIDDLTNKEDPSANSDANNDMVMWIAWGALGLSALSLGMNLRRK